MTGRMIRQKVAVRIIFLQPCRRVVSRLRIAASSLAVAPYALFVHVVRLIVKLKQGSRVVAAACACIFPFKLMYSVDGYISVFIQDAYGRVIQSRHIPLKSGRDNLVCVKSLYSQFFDLPDLCLKSHVERRIVLSVALSVHSVVRLTEMIGQPEEVKFTVVCQSRHFCRRIRLTDHGLISERRAEHIFKRHVSRGSVLRLSGMGVVFALHIPSVIRSCIVRGLHIRETRLEINVDLAFISLARHKVYVKEAFLLIRQSRRVRRICRIINLVRALVELKVAEESVSSVIRELIVCQDAVHRFSVCVRQRFHS